MTRDNLHLAVGLVLIVSAVVLLLLLDPSRGRRKELQRHGYVEIEWRGTTITLKGTDIVEFMREMEPLEK